jgi:hypothetical protein
VLEGERAHARREVAVGGERFEIARTIGRGGMGVVYEAHDRQFGRAVALKTMIGDSGSLRTRFVTEALITANLEHPGIAPVYERGFDAEGRPFYVMRLVQGHSLADAIAERRTMHDRLKLIPVVARVAQTLAFAHAHGVVHRDVKPDNVVLGRHGEAVLLDWGIAKVRGVPGASDADDLADVASSKATRHGAIVGTPAYMAPEQAAGSVDRIDERTDVFALGALLYHVLTGRPPFEPGETESALDRAREGAARPIVELAPDAPHGLSAIVERAMSRLPDDRHQSAVELSDALESYIAGALTAQDSRLVKAFTWVAGSIAVLMILVATRVVLSISPSLREQGVGAYVYLAFTVMGVSFSLIEWRTHGRYALLPIAAMLAICTPLMGFANAFSGMTLVLEGVGAQMKDGQLRAEDMLLHGTREALGNCAPSLLFAAIQLALIALVWRTIMRRKRALQH